MPEATGEMAINPSQGCSLRKNQRGNNGLSNAVMLQDVLPKLCPKHGIMKIPTIWGDVATG